MSAKNAEVPATAPAEAPYSASEAAQHLTQMTALNFRNRTLYHADNLPVLGGMNSETVDLIATDPPFDKSRDFHATAGSLAAPAKLQDRLQT